MSEEQAPAKERDSELTRYKVVVEYNGQGYAGWQRQPDIMTIQQAVEEAILGFSNQDVSIVAAGRTDAGVHARGQVFHVDFMPFSKPMTGYTLLQAINAFLRSHTISVIDVQEVDEDFHARYHAVNKLYQYRIINRPGVPALEQELCWHVGRPLDVEAMREGAKYLIGHHDFTSFRATECQAKSPIRTLDKIDIHEHPYDECGGRKIIIEPQAKSFLHHQVRNIVGTLSLVGLCKWQPKDVKTALEAKERAEGGPTAPANGLYLMRVDY